MAAASLSTLQRKRVTVGGGKSRRTCEHCGVSLSYDDIIDVSKVGSPLYASGAKSKNSGTGAKENWVESMKTMQDQITEGFHVNRA